MAANSLVQGILRGSGRSRPETPPKARYCSEFPEPRSAKFIARTERQIGRSGTHLPAVALPHRSTLDATAKYGAAPRTFQEPSGLGADGGRPMPGFRARIGAT